MHRSYDAADQRKLFANRPAEVGEIRATAMALQVRLSVRPSVIALVTALNGRNADFA
jgi:hypothetical protein